ncbi:hypothetical protein P9112_012567 [Eukaryota sp. TZLM1-RC]
MDITSGLDEPSPILAIVIDTSLASWATIPHSISFLFDVVAAFSSGFLSLNSQCKLAIIAATSTSSQYLAKSESYSDLAVFSTKLMQSFHVLASQPHKNPVNPYKALSSALSKALCFINSHHSLQSGRSQTFGHVIVISAASTQFSLSTSLQISLLNSAFSAKRDQIPIDIFALGDELSPLLEQVCDVACGSCHSVSTNSKTNTQIASELLQLLCFNSFVSLENRENLIVSSKPEADLRAFCYCHSKIVDIGYVCSACLAVSCQRKPRCPCCKQRISIAKR